MQIELSKFVPISKKASFSALCVKSVNTFYFLYLFIIFIRELLLKKGRPKRFFCTPQTNSCQRLYSPQTEQPLW